MQNKNGGPASGKASSVGESDACVTRKEVPTWNPTKENMETAQSSDIAISCVVARDDHGLDPASISLLRWWARYEESVDSAMQTAGGGQIDATLKGSTRNKYVRANQTGSSGTRQREGWADGGSRLAAG